MTHRDYVALSSLIRAEVSRAIALGDRGTITILSLSRLAEGIAEVCAQQNPSFNRQRFLTESSMQQRSIANG